MIGAGSAIAAEAVIEVGAQQHVGFKLALDGTYSTGKNPLGEPDSDGDRFGIKHYTWAFGDGTPKISGEYSNTVTHTYNESGTYTVRLTVTDYHGITDSVTTDIAVIVLPNVTVSGSTGAAIQSAIDSLGGAGIVHIPAGTYSVAETLRIPHGVTLKGDGPDKSVLKNTSSTNQYFLWPTGDNVRITGLGIAGPGDSNYGIYNGGRRNLFIDNCDIHGFQYASTVTGGGSTTYENNFIHNNPTPGYGYGIMVTNAGYAIARNNEFSNNRHNVASGGNGYTATNTGYDFINNHVQYADEAAVDVELDAHAGANGRIRIVDNLVEDVMYFAGFRDGWGEIRNNVLRNVSGYLMRIGPPTHNGTPVTGAGLRHFHFQNNEATNSSTRLWLEQGENIWFNCRRVDNLIPVTDLPLDWNDCAAAPNPPTGLMVN